jgi:hypothetical protein
MMTHRSHRGQIVHQVHHAGCNSDQEPNIKVDIDMHRGRTQQAKHVAAIRRAAVLKATTNSHGSSKALSDCPFGGPVEFAGSFRSTLGWMLYVVFQHPKIDLHLLITLWTTLHLSQIFSLGLCSL